MHQHLAHSASATQARMLGHRVAPLTVFIRFTRSTPVKRLPQKTASVSPAVLGLWVGGHFAKFHLVRIRHAVSTEHSLRYNLEGL